MERAIFVHGSSAQLQNSNRNMLRYLTDIASIVPKSKGMQEHGTRMNSGTSSRKMKNLTNANVAVKPRFNQTNKVRIGV